MLRFDTVNPPERERRCAEFLAEILRGGGFDVVLRDLDVDRANLIATLPGATRDAPLVFTGHVDVVSLGTRAWPRDPFAAECVDGRVYGRGSSDMKSGVTRISQAVDHLNAIASTVDRMSAAERV